MWRFAGFFSTRLLRLWLVIALGAALLVGLVVVSLTLPQGTGAVAQPALSTPAPTHTSRLTPTPRAGATLAGDTDAAGKVSPAPPWLVEGLAILFLVLIGFSLILFPLAARAARIERRNRAAFSPVPIPEEEQAARLSQIAPERKAPLSREQLRALRVAAQRRDDVARQPTARLGAVRVVDGVPVSMPITEAETMPHLPASPALGASLRPVGPRINEGRAQGVAGDGRR